MFVLDVLVNTAATATEVWAARVDPMGGSSNDGLQLCFEKFLVFACHARANALAIDHVRHEDRLPLDARHSFSPKGDIGDFELDYICHPERSRGIPMTLPLSLRHGILRLRYASLRMTR